MPKQILLLLLVISGLPFPSPNLFAQAPQKTETIGSQIGRLRYRLNNRDIDGVGELIEPLFTRVIGKAEPSLDLPRKHLIAVATMKFELASGDHGRAVLSYLIALHMQSELPKQPHHLLLVEPVDETESFRTKFFPTLFFTAEDQSHFRKQFDNAVEAGACLKTELTEAYYNADEDQLSAEQQRILDDISLVNKSQQPTDREIQRLIDHSVNQMLAHKTLANKSLSTAIDGLVKLKRDAEAGSLRRSLKARQRASARLLFWEQPRVLGSMP